MHKAVLLPFALSTPMYQLPQVALTGRKLSEMQALARSPIRCALKGLPWLSEEIAHQPTHSPGKTPGGTCWLRSLPIPSAPRAAGWTVLLGRGLGSLQVTPVFAVKLPPAVSLTTPPSASLLSPEWHFLLVVLDFIFFRKVLVSHNNDCKVQRIHIHSLSLTPTPVSPLGTSWINVVHLLQLMSQYWHIMINWSPWFTSGFPRGVVHNMGLNKYIRSCIHHYSVM